MKHTEILNILISGPLFHLLPSTSNFQRRRKGQCVWIAHMSSFTKLVFHSPAADRLHLTHLQGSTVAPLLLGIVHHVGEKLLSILLVFSSRFPSKIYLSEPTVIQACIHHVTYAWWMPDQIMHGDLSDSSCKSSAELLVVDTGRSKILLLMDEGSASPLLSRERMVSALPYIP